ncbi:N-acyl-D-amino-acid deacylase family protein [Euzebya tangerina]|uniref:N-acyl-D-amino-acid deacylase family protein n=1 Tax=Euzebya tangerina TaxID=591198 RepID=UPI000E313D59|nr:amidohydrolase family protein [Euzebya tangerina]
MTSAGSWDLLVTGGLVFDGHGGPPQLVDVALSGGRVAAVGPGLDPAAAARVVDASGRWVMPGLLDIHTHYDLELELAPGLPEAARHGTTTVITANCSLGTTFGSQVRDNGSYVENPIVDCFARVENMPKHVLQRVVDAIDWSGTAAYLTHLDAQPLGANVVPQIPHSMLRAEVMGLQGSVSRDPSDDDIVRMAQLLNRALEEGYPGFTTDALPFHFLANDPHRATKIPTQWTTREELRVLTHVVRAHDRVWQGTPPKDSPVGIAKTLFFTSGRWFGAPLRTTFLTSMDVHTDRTVLPLSKVLSRILNSRLVDGRFRMQALAAQFKVWADGPLTPLFEEIPSLRRLNEPDLEDRAGRRAILADPDWRAQFTREWMTGKDGRGLAGLRRRLRYEEHAVPRDLDQLVLDGDVPCPEWDGLTFAEVLRRGQAHQAGVLDPGSAAEREALETMAEAMPEGIHDAGLVLHLFAAYDTDLRWYAITANADQAKLEDALFFEHNLPGFNDSGAHLTNMAFYDANLRGLQIAARYGSTQLSRHIARLTSEPAAFWRIDAGSLRVGARGDVVIIDPLALHDWDPESTITTEYREAFDHEQMVNRPEGIVTQTVLGGTVVWDEGEYIPELGKVRLGQTLLATT